MAPILQCPDCGEKHPLAAVPNQGAFPCRGCGRVLKVPEAVGQRAAATAAAARPVAVATAVAKPSARPATVADPAATRVVPEADEQALDERALRSSRRPVARLGSVPWWMRLLLWFVAVPLGFVLVFLIARAFNLFTTNQLSDVFLADDTARFWPVARLLPFVALVTAGLVQGGVYGLARLRGRRSPNPPPLTQRQSGRR
jgi:hypothetical protein